MKMSLAEENYLKAIYHLSEGGESDVNTNSIADELNTKAASVTDMMRKLSDKDVINYQKYKGVQISKKGKLIALEVIRKHRLWEVFLVEKLAYSWDEVHDLAEQLEHIKSPTLINRLDKYLGYPTIDPHGDPIPNEHGEIFEHPQHPLAELEVGKSGVVVKVPDGNASLLQHLAKIKIRLGSKIALKEKVEFDNSVLINIDNTHELYLSGQIAQTIMIAIK
ncbi:MAG: metal-dependent transcriptional regulator [Cyclobacteriaceae bacterium]